ncbi:hypothetical protein TNCV_4670831 [Trichonephila clavipes]|nr:hypothetical protein TNCV_4670831 [Trichonephila clavipes]
MVCYPFFDREKHVSCRHPCHVTEVDDTEAISDSKVRKWVWKFKDGYLKHSLGGKRFSDNEEVKDVMNSWLSDQAADFFEEGFQNFVLRLRTEHLKGMKIHPDKTRSYVQCKHCPDLQLTPNHILECPTVATKLLKMGMVPLRDSLWELLYSPDAPRIAEAVIKTFDGI